MHLLVFDSQWRTGLLGREHDSNSGRDPAFAHHPVTHLPLSPGGVTCPLSELSRMFPSERAICEWYSARVSADGTVPSYLVSAPKRGTWVEGKLISGGPPGMEQPWAEKKDRGKQTATGEQVRRM